MSEKCAYYFENYKFIIQRMMNIYGLLQQSNQKRYLLRGHAQQAIDAYRWNVKDKTPISDELREYMQRIDIEFNKELINIE
jgi:hypothetical protein